MDSMFSLMDILIAGCGVYVLYVYVQLKYKGEINTTLLLPKDLNVKKCKDKAAYIAEIAPKVLIYGIIVLASGLMGVAEDVYRFMGNYYLLILAVFAAATIWFAKCEKDAIKKYW